MTLDKIVPFLSKKLGHVGTLRAGLMATSLAISTGEIPVPETIGKYAWLLAVIAVFIRAGEKNEPKVIG